MPTRETVRPAESVLERFRPLVDGEDRHIVASGKHFLFFMIHDIGVGREHSWDRRGAEQRVATERTVGLKPEGMKLVLAL